MADGWSDGEEGSWLYDVRSSECTINLFINFISAALYV